MVVEGWWQPCHSPKAGAMRRVEEGVPRWCLAHSSNSADSIPWIPVRALCLGPGPPCWIGVVAREAGKTSLDKSLEGQASIHTWSPPLSSPPPLLITLQSKWHTHHSTKIAFSKATNDLCVANAMASSKSTSNLMPREGDRIIYHPRWD